MKKLTTGLLAVTVLIALLAAGARAASIDDLYITPAPPAGEGAHPPGEATSNSIFTIQFTWHETDTGRLPRQGTLMIGTYVPYEGFTYFIFPQGAGKGDPMSSEGRLYEFRMTAGLNFKVSYPDAYQPPSPYIAFRDPNHPIPDLQDVYYMPGLVAKDPVTPTTIFVRAMDVAPPTGDPPVPSLPTVVGPVSCTVIVHDSHPWPQDRWAGQKHDRDFLYAYYAYNDATGAPKPIQSYGLNENFQWREPDDASNPDDGSTSTCWEFRVIYKNTDNLPPIPYLSSFGGTLGDDHLVWHRYNDEPWDSGVVLYLKNTSWSPDADFVAVPMRKVDPANNNYVAGVEYFYILEPAGWLNEYVGLPIGEYEYFFGCSDDYIRTKSGDIPSWLDHELEFLPSLTLLPKRAVTTPRNPSYNIWPSYMSWYNSGLYLDRPTLQPGVTNTYVLKAIDHPVISLGLRNPSQALTPWEATVEPLYEIVNPQTGHIQVGGARNQKWDFQIKYQHLYGILPEASQGSGYEISVWVNDSNQINPDPARADTVYKRYTLVLDKPTPSSPNPTATEIKNGVIYHLPNPIELKPGPHSYFFTASDGLKRARYPVDGHGHYHTGSHAFEGPYVNNRPVLENPAIDPPTGTAGDKFRYSVTYKDADNQRPYSAKIYIEYADGEVIVGEMIKENPADDDYDGVGVKYIFDTANMAQQFQEGQRRFYFEFTDDWGAPNDPRDRRRGEAVYWQSARPESWIFGPYINRNTIPQLLDGSVIATDGANNSATLFEYKVRYVDVDNHAPKYLDVYIGQVQPNGSISWDNGHLMDPVDPSDTVYSGDGALFRYYSRLTGEAAGKDYYYCFVASDRYDVAQYDAQLSPSAGTAVWFTRVPYGSPGYPGYKGERHPVVPPDPNEPTVDPNNPIFYTTHKPIVGPIPSAPTYNPYVSPMLFDAAGNQATYDSVDYINGIINARPVMPVGYIQYWFGTAGPTDVGVNHAPTLSGGSVSPNPGMSTSEFTYRVTYTDEDGTMGQPPYYIRVRIDGVAFDMTRAAGGEPNYKNGVTYFYRTTTLTPQLPHHYYFEASDGSGFAVFDKNGSRRSDQPIPIGAITWIPGPYVNNKPTLTAPATGAVYPIPGTPISTSQWLNFGIVYTDANNEWPSTGTPVVYIRKVDPLIPPIIGQAPEPLNDFKVRSVSVSGTVVTAENLDGSSPTWTLDQFKGLPLQFTNGTAAGTSYRVESNTASTVTLLAQSLPGVAASNTFSIGKIRLTKDPNDNNCADGTDYSYRLNSLGEGDYAVHFMSSTDELIGENNLRRTTVLRYPAIGEITGLKVTSTAPVGNWPPVLSKQPSSDFVSPSIGLYKGLFTFKVTYSDANGDAPIFRQVDYVTGYVRLIIDGVLPGIDMTGPPSPNYVTGAEFTWAGKGSPEFATGKHTFYFEASDGWAIARYPTLGTPDLEFYINRKPVLVMEDPAVIPKYGNAGMDYTFAVKYKDADNRAPDPALGGEVLVWVNDTSYPMTLDTSGGTNFVTGVRYTKTLHGSDLIVSDASDANKFYFTANDGLEPYVANDPPVPPALPVFKTVTINGPIVHVNHAPELKHGTVSPTGGSINDDYVYRVIYSDVDGDLPEFVKVDIYINGVGAPLTFDMQTAAGDPDFETGVVYTYTKQGLPLGKRHTFAFRTTDFLDSAELSGGTAPNVGYSLQINQPAPAPRIDVAGVLTGSISPARVADLTLTFKRPNDSQFTRRPVTTAANGGTFTTPWTPDTAGTWQVKAAWEGDEIASPAESPWTTIQVSVRGPREDMSGLKMISIPVDPVNGFPGNVFGNGSYALAQYRPLQNDYAYYRSVPALPGNPEVPLSDIELGGGYWIKVYGGSTVTAEPSGSLAPTTLPGFEIHLLPGWNQIGCPFNGSVNWSALKVKIRRDDADPIGLAEAAGRGWVRSYGWAFEQSSTNPYAGTYRPVDPTRNGALRTIDPWRGYWFKALVDCYLVVPPPGTLNMEALKPLAIESANGSGWEVNLTATVGGKSDTFNGFGVASAASKLESPGYLDGFVDLYFTDAKGGVFAYDVRSNASDGETWIVKVATDQSDGLMELSWEGIETLPSGSTLTLVDETTGKSTQMKPGGVYTFPAAEAVGGRLFRVILGAN